MALLKISQLNKDINKLMTRVGDAMLIKTHSNFRVLLPKLHPVESSLSLFMRHAICCKQIKRKCIELKAILDKDFIVGCCLGPIVIRSQRDRRTQDSPKTRNALSLADSSPSTNTVHINGDDNIVNQVCSRNAVTVKEIDVALSISLELMNQDALSYFLSSGHVKIQDVNENLISSSERLSIIQHCSEQLENLVLSLAGQCGAKVYKYLKMRQFINGSIGFDLNDPTSNTRSNHTNVITNYPTIADAAHCNQPPSKTAAEYAEADRMDRARLLMQLVICRDLKLALIKGPSRMRLASRSGVLLKHSLIESVSVAMNNSR